MDGRADHEARDRNGISILIFASILVGAPIGIAAWWNGGPMEKLFYPLIALAIVAAVVFVQEASGASRSSTRSGWWVAG